MTAPRRAVSGLAVLLLATVLPAGAADPLIDLNFQISDIAIVDGDRDAVRTAVAYNSNSMDGEILVVWEGDGLADPDPNPTMVDNDDLDEIFGRILDSLGNTVVADFRISNSSDAGTGLDAANPAVAYDSAMDRYLVVWQADTSTGGEIFGQLLNAAGDEVGADFQISNASGSVALRDASNPAVAYNATDGEFLVVWQDGAANIDEILGQRVGAFGALIGTEEAISNIAGTGTGRSAANPALAHDSAANAYLVVWEGNGTAGDPDAEAIFGRLVSADGTPVSLADNLIAASRAVRPDVAFNSVDGDFLVVFQAEAPALAQSQIQGRRVGADGAPDGAAFPISQGLQARAPAVAHGSGNNQHLVVWQVTGAGLEHEIFGRLVSGPGAALGSEFAVSSVIGDAGADRDAASPAVTYSDLDNLYLAGFEADAVLPANTTDDLTEIFGQFAEPFFPDLAVTKDDGGAPAAPGATVSYAISVENLGDGPAPGTVLTETVPAGTTFDPMVDDGFVDADWMCNPMSGAAGATCRLDLGTVEAGAAIDVIFAAILDADFRSGVDETTNTVAAAGDGTGGLDLTPADNTANDTTTIDAAPDLTITKDDGLATPVMPGATITYALAVANNGTQDADTVAITETVPLGTTFDAAGSTAGWSCADGSAAGTSCTLALGDLAVGAGAMASFAVTLDTLLPAGTPEIANTASVADDGANGADLNSADNTAIDTTPVEAVPDLRLAKDDGDVAAGPGLTLAYSLTVNNDGNEGASGVTLTETVPANTTFNAAASTAGWVCTPDSTAGSICTLAIGTVAAGGSAAATFAVTVDSPLPPAVVEIVNNASVADDGANGTDPTPANNTDSDTTPVSPLDLQLTKSDGDVSVMPGDPLVYALTVTNGGLRPAAGVTLTETVPANTTFDAAASTAGWACAPNGMAGATCTLAIGVLAPGQSFDADYAVTVAASVPAGVAVLSNTASAADDGTNGPDGNLADNSATETTPVNAAPDLVLAKDDGGATVTPGDTVAYGLTATNNGNRGATGVIVTETVPANTAFNAGASSPGWSCADGSAAGMPCTLALGTLAAGGSQGATFAVTVDGSVAAGVTEVANSASVADDGANGADPTPGDNDARDTTPIGGAPDLRLRKSDRGARVAPGGTLVYQLRVANIGVRGATGVTLTETVPNNTVFDGSASSRGWTCARGGRPGATCSFPLGTMAPGAERSADFAVTLRNRVPDRVGAIRNRAVVAPDGGLTADANPGNNRDRERTPVTRTRTNRPLNSLLAFFDASIANGTLDGIGGLLNADLARKAFRLRITKAIKLIDEDRSQRACRKLRQAVRLSDGQPDPDDLVAGPSRPALARKLVRVRDGLGCRP